ncbi:hypothetical protein AYY16_09795 [Morganella psychrotolerans]|nr:hypothetical protein AYY16_09795 [Morganella psychrotolerans]
MGTELRGNILHKRGIGQVCLTKKHQHDSLRNIRKEQKARNKGMKITHIMYKKTIIVRIG